MAALDPIASLLQMDVRSKREERGRGGCRGGNMFEGGWGVGGEEGEEVGAPEEVAALDPVAGLLQMEVRGEEGELRGGEGGGGNRRLGGWGVGGGKRGGGQST